MIAGTEIKIISHTFLSKLRKKVHVIKESFKKSKSFLESKIDKFKFIPFGHTVDEKIFYFQQFLLEDARNESQSFKFLSHPMSAYSIIKSIMFQDVPMNERKEYSLKSRNGKIKITMDPNDSFSFQYKVVDDEETTESDQLISKTYIVSHYSIYRSRKIEITLNKLEYDSCKTLNNIFNVIDNECFI